MKKIKITLALAFATSFFSNAFAQMVGPDCYIKGNLVEIGINGPGGYEGVDTFTSAPLAGMHFRSNTQYFGFVANPQMNGWAGTAFDGDFFTPGTPENGWGFECIDAGGISNNQSNNRAIGSSGVDIPGALSSWSMIGTCILADWNGGYVGSGYDLEFHINYYLNTPDLYYTTTVTVTNNGALIPDFYYYRNFDPDNNVVVAGGTYTTTNTIVSQPGSGCNKAHVSATQTTPWSSYVGMAGVGSQFRVSKGGFSNRDASDIWNGLVGGAGYSAVGAVSTSDEAISLGYRIQNFAAGASETFKFVVILDDLAAANAINNLFYVTYPGSGASASVCNPTIDTVTTCPGVGVPIGVAGSALADFSWSWSPTSGLTPTTGPSVTAAPLTSTLYTITGTPINPCFAPVTQQIFVEVTPPPTITCPTPPTVCPGISASMTATGAGVGGTYTWSPATGLSATTGASVTATPAATTTYTITGTTAAGCIGTTTVTVTVGGSATITVPPATNCVGSPGVLLTASGAATYVWSPATGLSATTGTSVTATPASTTTYTITGTTAAGCTGTTTSIVTINPLPVVTCAPATICNGSSTPLTASGASTYSWSPATGLSATTGATVTASPTTTTTYTISGTSAAGCVSSTTVIVTVNPLPTVVVPSSTMCALGSTTLTASGASTYTWSPGTGLSATTGTTVTANPAVTTTYTITGTSSLGCINTTTATVTITGTATITVAPASICNGTSTTLSASGASTYTWSPATGLSATTGTSVTANPTTTTTYTINGTDASGCSGTTTTTLTVNPLPTVPVSTTPETCAGACDGVAGTAPLGGLAPYNYLWSNGGTSPFISSLCSGTYTVHVTDANGCIDSASATITGAVAVSIISVTPTSPSCNGGANGTIVINASPTATNFSIDGGVTFSASNTFTGLVAGCYTAVATDPAGCSATTVICITEPTAITVTPGAASTICFGQTATVSATGTGGTGALSYSWTDASGAPVGTGATITVTPTTVGANVYTVSVTDANGCGPITTTVTVTMNPQLSVTASADQTLCPGSSTTISAVGSGGNGGPYTFIWTNNIDASSLTGSSVSVTPTTSTVYTVTLTDNCGTPAVTDIVNINLFALPGVNYTIDTNQGCTPVVVNFANTTSAGGSPTITWNFGDGTTGSGTNVMHAFTDAGCYDISLNITTTDGCSVDTTIFSQICVFNIPQPDFSFSPQPTDIFDTEINFTNLTIGGSTYSWDFAGLGASGSTNPSFVFPNENGGTYSVCLSTVSSQGCVASICHDVVILDQFIIYVPNSFTPDNDGHNEMFIPMIQGENPDTYELYIFDRWGEVIFKSTDKTIGWDGTHKNVKCKEDVYVWKIRVKKSMNKEKIEKIGHVNLLR